MTYHFSMDIILRRSKNEHLQGEIFISTLLRLINQHSRLIKRVCIFITAVTVIINFPVQFVKSVSVIDGKEKYNVFTMSDDAESILRQSDIKLNNRDDYDVTADGSDITITIKRRNSVALIVGGKREFFETSADTVGEFLKNRGYSVDKYDEVTPSLDTVIDRDTEIVFNDVEYFTETKTVPIAYTTKKIETDSLELGETKTTQSGKNGEKEIITFKKTVNGVETETTVNEAILTQPTEKIVKVGVAKESAAAAVESVVAGRSKKGGKAADQTKWMSDLTPKKQIKLDKNGIPVEYKKMLTGNASAYCTGTTCSTGVSVKQGYIAVDPNIIPYGTEMYIRTSDGSWIYGYAIAADTGGFVTWGNTIADLYMYSLEDCRNFGRRQIEIYIL